MLLLLYRHSVSPESLGPAGLRWVKRHANGPKSIRIIRSSVHEQKLLLRLLDSNSKRIPESYRPSRSLEEREFTASFILPTGTIEPVEVGRFTRNACAVCTTPATASCGACHNVYYCGPGMIPCIV